MSRIAREQKVNMFTPALGNNPNARFVMLSGEGGKGILTNSYIKRFPRLRGEGKGEVLSRRAISIGGSV